MIKLIIYKGNSLKFRRKLMKHKCKCNNKYNNNNKSLTLIIKEGIIEIILDLN